MSSSSRPFFWRLSNSFCFLHILNFLFISQRHRSWGYYFVGLDCVWCTLCFFCAVVRFWRGNLILTKLLFHVRQATVNKQVY
ncbi:hypothetical protein BGX38DRAFT_1169237 [Terfezia claveryi]|nr:hypothetical protein BGX38DRAFT_1169237 [Terfezia claveryi]